MASPIQKQSHLPFSYRIPSYEVTFMASRAVRIFACTVLLFAWGCWQKKSVFKAHQQRKYPAVEAFEKYAWECAFDAEKDLSGEWSESCPSGPVVPIRGKNLKIKSLDTFMAGSFGNAYVTDDDKFVVKALYNRKGLDEFCHERAVLKVLNGLNGVTVKSYEVIQTKGVLTAHCASRVIVMESAGKYRLETIKLDKDDPLVYKLAVRLLEMIKTFHEAGFAHGDAHNRNIMYSDSSNPEGTLKFIDLGMATPLAQVDGMPKSKSEKNVREDMLRIAESLEKLLYDEKSHLFRDFREEMTLLGPTDQPNYDYWIKKYNDM